MMSSSGAIGAASGLGLDLDFFRAFSFLAGGAASAGLSMASATAGSAGAGCNSTGAVTTTASGVFSSMTIWAGAGSAAGSVAGADSSATTGASFAGSASGLAGSVFLVRGGGAGFLPIPSLSLLHN